MMPIQRYIIDNREIAVGKKWFVSDNMVPRLKAETVVKLCLNISSHYAQIRMKGVDINDFHLRFILLVYALFVHPLVGRTPI